MSLAAIRNMRMQRQKPDSVIWVVVGPVPKHFAHDIDVVAVPAGSEPEFMDWRPLVGLPVALFDAVGAPHLSLKVMEALKAANVRFMGFASKTLVVPFNDKPEDEKRFTYALRGCLELLCPA